MKALVSLPYSQQLVTGSSCETIESTSCTETCFFNIQFYDILFMPRYFQVFRSRLFTKVYALLIFPTIHLGLIFVIILYEGTDYEGSHSVVFSILLLVSLSSKYLAPQLVLKCPDLCSSASLRDQVSHP